MKCPKCGGKFSLVERLGSASHCSRCDDRQFVKEATSTTSEEDEVCITHRDIEEARPGTIDALRVTGRNNLLFGAGLLVFAWLAPLVVIVKEVPVPNFALTMIAIGCIFSGGERALRGLGQCRLARILKSRSLEEQ